MEFGKVEYVVFDGGNGHRTADRSLKLTLIGQGDEETLAKNGLAGLRRKRIVRLTKEAMEQGCMLSYEDLSGLLVTSLATLKRDVSFIEGQGIEIFLKGRRKNGNSASGCAVSKGKRNLKANNFR
jgi:hypothetical protein